MMKSQPPTRPVLYVFYHCKSNINLFKRVPVKRKESWVTQHNSLLSTFYTQRHDFNKIIKNNHSALTGTYVNIYSMHRWAGLLKAQMFITVYHLPTKENKLPFPLPVCSKQTEVEFSVSPFSVYI
jgi:hypothetical protein